jgi:hypothetical protein
MSFVSGMGNYPASKRPKLTPIAICIMVFSSIAGAWNGTKFYGPKGVAAHVTSGESQQSDKSPISRGSQQCDNSPLPEPAPSALESHKAIDSDRAVQGVSGEDDTIGMGWGCSSPKECRIAINALTKDIRQNPKSSNRYCKRAWMYYTIGQFRKAIKDANKSLRLNPKNEDAREVRSNAYGSLGLNPTD